jgi:hypothetical protein
MALRKAIGKESMAILSGEENLQFHQQFPLSLQAQ